MPEVEIALIDVTIAPTFTQADAQFNIDITPADGEAMDFDFKMQLLVGNRRRTRNAANSRMLQHRCNHVIQVTCLNAW